MKNKFLRRFLKIMAGFITLIFILIVACIRPVDHQPYQETRYYQNTLASLEKAIRSLPETKPAQLIVGAGKAGLTPPIGVPLAGYGNRKGAPSIGVNDSLFVRAIVLQSGDRVVCLIGYDALLCPTRFARMIEDSIKHRFDLNADQLLFTATHTHAGPGGWADGWVEEQFAGPPDGRIQGIFIDSTLVAIGRALDKKQAAGYRVGAVKAPQFIRNRLVGDKGKVDDELVYVVFSDDDKTIAVFATYSAHATVLSAGNMLFSGDYPGYLERKIESTLGGVALFAVAGLGSQRPHGPGKSFEKARNIGYALGDSLLSNLVGRPIEMCDLKYFRLPVDKHDLQIRISQNWRLAPWLARRFFNVKDSYMQVVKLDRVLIIGSPAEFSGELALQVKEHARGKGLMTTITSFNGCYLGYVVPSTYYSLPEYETRLMSFLGPYTGDYFADIMKRIVDGVAPPK